MASDREQVRHLRLFLNGFGKMGREVASLALEEGHEIVGASSGKRPIVREDLEQVDVCIDFSSAAGIEDLLSVCVAAHVPLVIGTTGWENALPRVKIALSQVSIGVFYSPNFSIGMALFSRIVAQAARLIDPFFEYDVAGWESHHRNKADNPSGTARALGKVLLTHLSRKTDLSFDGTSPTEQTIPYSSLRCGSTPGTHAILFDSSDDTITLTHQARSRKGFARGALHAALWILGKKGFFTMDDWVEEQLRNR